MNIRTLLPVLFLLTAFGCCNNNNINQKKERWKDEIVATEKAFADMAAKEGIPHAFVTFAAEDAVLLRNDQLIKGKDALRDLYHKNPPGSDKVSLTWNADFVDVSESGDLGYTYGTYVYTTTDSMGVARRDTGIFHTVWKRQSDGQWRFVWD